MPFQSDRQRRFMFAKHPQIARRWADEEKEQGSEAVEHRGRTLRRKKRRKALRRKERR